MNHADATSGLSTPPDPSQDRCKPVPPHIADILSLLQILLGYGRHLALTLDRRAAAGRFAVLAQFFGTARVPVIRARLARGILRIQALQRVLLARARRGRDLVYLRPRPPGGRKPPPDQQELQQQEREQRELQQQELEQREPQQRETVETQAGPPPPRPAPLRRPDPDAAPDPDNLPTLRQLEAEIRRRPIGRTIADICRDLGVSPTLCERRFWNALFEAITWYRGNLPGFANDIRRRKAAFEPEWDRDYRLGLPEDTEKDIRGVLGFFIGAQWPVLPNPLPLALRLRGMPTGPP